MTIITPNQESNHYYTRAGLPAYGATMKEVRKHGYVPSVNTVLSDDRAFQLENWKQLQVALECWANPRCGFEGRANCNGAQADHAREDWAKARVARAREVSMVFADFGTRFHDGAEEVMASYQATGGVGYVRDQPRSIGLDTGRKEVAPFVDAFEQWVHENVREVHWFEKCLVHPLHRWAGRVDAFINHKEHGDILVDYKTRKLRQLKSGKYSCSGTRYEKDCEQLAAYSYIVPDQRTRVMNLYIHREEPAEPVEYLWPEEAQEHWLRSFELAAWRWTLKHKYEPENWKEEEEDGDTENEIEANPVGAGE